MRKKRQPPSTIPDILETAPILPFHWQPNNLLTLVSATFLQPRLDKPSDFRILNQEALKLAISKKLSFTAHWDSLFDTSPAEEKKYV